MAEATSAQYEKLGAQVQAYLFKKAPEMERALKKSDRKQASVILRITWKNTAGGEPSIMIYPRTQNPEDPIEIKACWDEHGQLELL